MGGGETAEVRTVSPALVSVPETVPVWVARETDSASGINAPVPAATVAAPPLNALPEEPNRDENPLLLPKLPPEFRKERLISSISSVLVPSRKKSSPLVTLKTTLRARR